MCQVPLEHSTSIDQDEGVTYLSSTVLVTEMCVLFKLADIKYHIQVLIWKQRTYIKTYASQFLFSK